MHSIPELSHEQAPLPRNRRHGWQQAVTAMVLAGVLDTSQPARAQDASGSPTGNRPNDGLLASQTNDLMLLDFGSPGALTHLTAPKSLALSQSAESVAVSGPMEAGSQSLTLRSGAQPWNLSNYLYLAADVHNGGSQELTLICRAEDPDYAGWHHYAESVARVRAGETASVLVFLKRKNPPADALRALFPGMNALPDGYMTHWSGMDPARLTQIVLRCESTAPGLKLELLRLRAVGSCDATALTAPGYFPFIDSYGQFRHVNWPTKIHSPRDFAVQRTAEAAALRASPRPVSWDKYGGFKEGPRLAATGHFRVEKYDGKWWLVDPDGRLFWSHGVTGVGFSDGTPVTGRRNFFATLPPLTPGGSSEANFYLANLKLKYGAGAESTAINLAHKRLASWGLNTLACWSDANVTGRDQTPYTKILDISGPKLAPGLKLSDPFDPAFTRAARRAFESERNTTAKDPWCVGYFIGNELEWRNGPAVINAVLTAPAEAAGKKAFVKLLRQRHPAIAGLNSEWHTTYASWNDLLDRTNQVDATLALKDFTAFNEALAERYYQICETQLKRATPDMLNLGSRFNTVNAIAVRAAARYCDVVSFNKYETSIRNLSLPDGLDRPVIIGEFHFPAWDRSFAANAGCGRLTEVRRADCYWYYLTGALDNPLVVGTHWFQYLDQPLTGRPDGENAPIGFVDVTDTPYDELTKVTRELGDTLYARRLEAGLPAEPPNLTTGKGKATGTRNASTQVF